MLTVRKTIVVLLSCLPIAMAQAHPDTSRQQVLDDLARARATGDLEVPGELGGLMRDRYPGLYATPSGSGLTREAVRDELQAALRRGDVPHGDVDVAAGRAPVVGDARRDVAQGLTRAQVREALAQAISVGDVEETGDAGRLLRDIRGAHPAHEPGKAEPARYAMSQPR